MLPNSIMVPPVPSVLTVVTPVFAIILIGFLIAQRRLLPEGTGKGVSDFIFNVAMPAMLFRTMATVEDSGVAPFGLLVGYFGANLATWLLASVATTRLLKRPAEDAPALSMAACFGNTVMLGLPLGTAYFGDRAASAIAVIVAVHAPILWMVATLQQEWIGRGDSGKTFTRLREIAIDLAKNPIIASVILGSVWRLSGIGLPVVADKTLGLLGQAAVPGALFALGMSLTRFEVRSDLAALSVITALKLLVMPVIAWAISARLLGLAPIGTDAVTLLAACPTGANAFLFASRYNRGVGPVSGAIAAGTVVAALTVSLTLLILSKP
jgi:malonate transporter and related proteins